MHTANDLMVRGVVVCVLCFGSLRYHDCYDRKTKDEDGHRHFGWIAQGYCKDCKVYPALIPDFIMPHKHYSAEVIEAVIAESESGRVVEQFGGCAADVSTMRRWIKQFNVRGASAVGWMIAALFEVYERHLRVFELRQKKLLNQLARLLHEFPDYDGGSIFGTVNIILTTRNCGFL